MAFRKHTLLPLDHCLYALQATIPHLTRSSLHRCYQRHGISRLPDVEGDQPAKKAFKKYPIGYFPSDIAEVRTKKVSSISSWPLTAPQSSRSRSCMKRQQGPWPRTFCIAAVPYKIHTVLTDIGTHFTTPGNICSLAQELRECLARGELFWAHAFGMREATMALPPRRRGQAAQAFRRRFCCFPCKRLARAGYSLWPQTVPSCGKGKLARRLNLNSPNRPAKQSMPISKVLAACLIDSSSLAGALGTAI